MYKSTTELTIEQALQQAVEAHKVGKLQDAEALYRAILQAQPKHPDANHNLGVMAVSLNKTEAALPLFKIALEANPNQGQFWLSYIDALIKEKQFDNARNVLEQGKKRGLVGEKVDVLEAQLTPIALVEKSESILPKQPSSFTQQNKTVSVKKKNSSSNQINPNQVRSPSQVEVNALLEHYQKGRYDSAENLAKTITHKYPDHQFGWKVLGAVFGQTGRLQESLIANQRAVAISPNDAQAHCNLGATLKELGRLEDAEASCKKAIAIKPDYAEAHCNLGNTLQELGRLEDAETSYKKAIAIKPDLAEAHYNLGATLKELGRLEDAEASYKKAIAIKPEYANAHSNLGFTLKELGRLEDAETSYKKAIAIKPHLAEAHNNLGNLLQELGRLEDAETSYNKAIAIKPDYAEAHYNLGVTLLGLNRLKEAEASYIEAVELRSNFNEASFNLMSCSKSISDAEYYLDKCLVSDPNYKNARLIKAVLRFYQGDRTVFDELMQSEFKEDPFMRSFAWVFDLPRLPELHFNRWYFYDSVINHSIISNPFYEFGVWRAASFKYLIKAFKKGYGFDTFTGLPEDWVTGDRIEKAGYYSSDSIVPKIAGGEFIVGKFEETLPVFFSKERPIASVINFDADLYSSTICALNFSKSVIDRNTILIFDEMIMNDTWEQDEFKALNEFCAVNHLSYEVIAVSFLSKQVAVKLIGI